MLLIGHEELVREFEKLEIEVRCPNEREKKIYMMDACQLCWTELK